MAQKPITEELKDFITWYTFGNDREWYWSLSNFGVLLERNQESNTTEVIGEYA